MVDDLQSHTMCTIALCANQPIPIGLNCDDFATQASPEKTACQAAMDAYVKVSEDAPLSYLTTPWTFDEDPAIQGWQCLPLFDSYHWSDLQVQGKKLLTANHPRPYFGILNGLLQCAENETQRGDPILLELQLLKIIAFIQDVMGYDPGELEKRFQELKDEELNRIVNENIMVRYSRLTTHSFQPGARKDAENRWIQELFTQMVFRLQQRPSYSVAQLEAIIEDFSESFNPDQKSLIAIYLQEPTDVLRKRIGPFPNFSLEDEKIGLTLAESSEKLQLLLLKTIVMLADEHLDMKPGLRQVLQLCRDDPALCEHSNQQIAADYLNGRYESGGVVFHKEVIPEVVLRKDPFDFHVASSAGLVFSPLNYSFWSGRQEQGGVRYSEGTGPALLVGGRFALGVAADWHDRHYLSLSALIETADESGLLDDQPILAYPKPADADDLPLFNMRDLEMQTLGAELEYGLGLWENWRIAAGAGLYRVGVDIRDIDGNFGDSFASWQLVPRVAVMRQLIRSGDGRMKGLAGMNVGRMIDLSGCTTFPADAGRSLCLNQVWHAAFYGQWEWGFDRDDRETGDE